MASELAWLALQIFLAEMLVVTFCTLRIIFIARGKRWLVPVLGFLEVASWLFAIGKTMQNLEQPACSIAFVLGFTAGNFLGMLIEKALALGTVLVRIITPNDATELVACLRAGNHGVTCVKGAGATGEVEIIMTIVQRKQLAGVMSLIEAHHPRAFYAIDDIQAASEGIFPTSRQRPGVLPAPLRQAFALPKLPLGAK